MAGSDLRCDAAICGVDNNPARIAASRYFRGLKIPVIFTAVSADADHGYVFVQEATGPALVASSPMLSTAEPTPVLRLLPLPTSCRELER